MTNRLGPIQQMIPLTIADQNFSPPLRGVIVGGSGKIRIQTKGMSAAELTNILPAGTYPADIVRIEASGTTATELTGYR